MGVCVCVCVCVCMLTIASMDKILSFTNTLIVVYIWLKGFENNFVLKSGHEQLNTSVTDQSLRMC